MAGAAIENLNAHELPQTPLPQLQAMLEGRLGHHSGRVESSQLVLGGRANPFIAATPDGMPYGASDAVPVRELLSHLSCVMLSNAS